ncbi:hypothetical protein Dole_1256 [Desulfosudis oleivorans Hxd3]|uniref:Uncharacterized protein n=1 Tax=Desulfosudis oleivorans (strain DSM 6200 / JCM 39069 / Hxd3) TaxID=96561 RepID=A8ZY55_DESOH|nr:hypothetical protein Dole_1256 [Desulfosudis oleivorans Hxd3]
MMTWRLPQTTLADKLLALAGKKRAIHIPEGVYKALGPYVTVRARKESFWRALFRPEGKVPPRGWFYPDIGENQGHGTKRKGRHL